MFVIINIYYICQNIKSLVVENSRNEYPKIKYLNARRGSFKVDPKDPNFDKPLAELETTYDYPTERKIIESPDYGEFKIIICQ